MSDAYPAPHPLDAACELHRRRFGREPGLFLLLRSYPGKADELARLILAAIAANKPFDAAAVEREWGISIPPGASS